MLTETFLHLPGIGPATEKKLRAAGVCSWAELCGNVTVHLKSRDMVLDMLAESQSRLAAGDAAWFSARLPNRERWRLYPHFHTQAAYVDIETTGLGGQARITTIALCDDGAVKTYVRGRNLEDFARDAQKYALLVSWNGLGFDLPFLRRELGIPLDMAQLDLLPVFRSLDLRGGLKAVEKRLGLERPELDGVDGYAAVLLWREFRRSGNERALETLLAYNVADVLSLPVLARHACAAFGVRLAPWDGPGNP